MDRKPKWLDWKDAEWKLEQLYKKRRMRSRARKQDRSLERDLIGSSWLDPHKPIATA